MCWRGRPDGSARPFGRRGRRSSSKAAKGEAGLWQRRFWEHHIRDGTNYANHVRYCWINPVKHGLARRAVDWPYLSIHRDIARGIVEPEWAGSVPDGCYGE
jgi:putative transposase